MGKRFNTTGLCKPDQHYMVDISDRLDEIESMVSQGDYFAVNRGRQYGKTTMLSLLRKRLEGEYAVFFISFEGIGEEAFADSDSMFRTFCGLLYDVIDYGEISEIPDTVAALLLKKMENRERKMMFRDLSNLISTICKIITKPVILMIDEVDQAGNYKAFIEFLGMLREKYLKRDTRDTFQSVILAGVYDIKNLKLKIRTEGEHQYNSPWNIAVNTDVNMAFQTDDIMGMLMEYESERETGMNLYEIAGLLFDYTDGYPFLVSRLCQIMDERLPKQETFSDWKMAWSREGVLEAVKILLMEANTLFDDMRKKLEEYPELRSMLYDMLYTGVKYPFNVDDFAVNVAKMFNFIKNDNGTVAVANRIFETRLYNLFVSEESKEHGIYLAGSADKNQFVHNGHLDMKKKIAIITGASSGMGREFVRQLNHCTRTLDEVWVIARRQEQLTALQKEVKNLSLKVLPLDLCNNPDMDFLAELLEAGRPSVRLLINAAGIGKAGNFEKLTRQEACHMVELNDRALVGVTSMVLPYMSPKSNIIQLASASAFLPQKEFAVYAASKAFVLSFSRALGAELKEKGILVTTVCPGPVDTAFLKIANGGKEQKWIKRIVTVKAEPVVAKALRDAKAGKELSIYGVWMHAVWIASKLLPHRLFCS